MFATSRHQPSYSKKIKKRFFLVGCSRSGTTLLQVLLASLPEVFSVPESSFFINAVGTWRSPRRYIIEWLGLAAGKEWVAARRFLTKIGRDDLLNYYPKRNLLFRTAVERFVNILDLLAVEKEKSMWIEKSPMHIKYLKLITRHIPRVHIIHIIRDGRDVVASIHDRALKYPDKFGRQRNLEYSIQLWNHTLDISLQYINNPRHHFVLYEHLVHKPDNVLRKLCDDIGIEYDSQLMKNVSNAAKQVILPHWEWVMNAALPPHPQPSKFDQIFEENAQALISRSLKLENYEKIKAIVLP